jgi:hypothetical protein
METRKPPAVCLWACKAIMVVLYYNIGDSHSDEGTGSLVILGLPSRLIVCWLKKDKRLSTLPSNRETMKHATAEMSFWLSGLCPCEASAGGRGFRHCAPTQVSPHDNIDPWCATQCHTVCQGRRPRRPHRTRGNGRNPMALLTGFKRGPRRINIFGGGLCCKWILSPLNGTLYTR